MAGTKRRKWLPIVAGVAIVLVFLAIGAAVVAMAWFRENVQVEKGASEASAITAFDEALKAFPDRRPLLELHDDRTMQLVPGVESRKNPGTVSALNILVWDPDEQALARVSIPMWLLRLKSGPIELSQHIGDLGRSSARVTAEDIERHGPGVLFEHNPPSGERVLVMAQ